ncbi:MAG TPA: ParB N-terminal domain-containing protein [Baekduia sp.]|uniref:ParB/RepB/Spo0J family partition protein n=1 Tax=Baekduia sp. TaxID=2600305 RepID=UPI002D78A812|nr:ParB N-terminal domain-containing protein [Baekduia sp.]HET6505730.1 ParB N-terminal domain-containing protein [Baekduia sp.]
MAQVDQLQEAEEQVAQMREEAARSAKEEATADLQRSPLSDTATKAHKTVEAPLSQVRTMVNMRVGQLPDLHDLAVSIKETGLLHPPLVRATGEDDVPYELLAGRRRFGAMTLLDEAEGPREGGWRFTLIDGISKREALTMQFAENFHQSKPEPVQFARAARAIMAEDPSLTAAEVSRMVGAPLAWTRKSLKLLDLPENVVQRVEEGDLSFTVADIVRRGIARGDVSAEEASELVEQHAAGEISGGALKLGVGYVPPKPKNYEEESKKLDEARWAANREKGLGKDQDAEQRDWDSSSSGGGANGSQGGPIRDASELLSSEPRIVATYGPGSERSAGGDGPIEVAVEDLDAYILGLVLSRVATAAHREHLGVEGGHEATQEYAFSLHPERRLEILRALSAEILAADPLPPKPLRSVLAA